MDERYQVTTPENVTIDFELAGIGSRMIALLLDQLIMTGVMFGLFAAGFTIMFVVAALNPPGQRLPQELFFAAVAIGLLLGFVVFSGYDMFFEIVWNGQTPGKRIAGIRVVMADGGPVRALAAVIRNVVRVVDFLPAYYIIGGAAMLIDGKARRLGDLAAGTLVVKERRDVAVDRLALAIPAPGALPAAAVSADRLRLVDYDDYYLVKEYLLRRDTLAPGPARDLAAQIARRIAAKLDLRLDGERPEDFLARVGAALERQGRR